MTVIILREFAMVYVKMVFMETIVTKRVHQTVTFDAIRQLGIALFAKKGLPV